MKQEELAALVGSDQPTISKWERDLQRPSLEHLRAVEEATGRPRGFVLLQAGCVDDVTTVEEAIAVATDLDDAARRALLGTYQSIRTPAAESS